MEDSLTAHRDGFANSTELKTSEFIAKRVAELDQSLKGLIVDGDEGPEV